MGDGSLYTEMLSQWVGQPGKYGNRSTRGLCPVNVLKDTKTSVAIQAQKPLFVDHLVRQQCRPRLQSTVFDLGINVLVTEVLPSYFTKGPHALRPC